MMILLQILILRCLRTLKKCKKQKYSRNVQLTRHYLKDNDSVAVPFDKGTGICVRKVNRLSRKADEHPKIITISETGPKT